ncbi:zinc ribbon domain-containing protein [Exiguobacterium oxidotolerans]|uniref:Uncharacterized protein n=1 Tax=Exiguobacterium oxidotolerans TaxID=223958 RepID=A0A653I7Y5_9BACL|nr:zinc ribbon domain-containing protein [Exiguobacterium oxidotolerans]VWX35188.1 conserved hypothetical protein [Exiguobacterium oxidotolerans]
MERCSLCGTPLKSQDTACSHCQHPVTEKKRLHMSSTSSSHASKKRHPLFWTIAVMTVFVISFGAWSWFGPTTATKIDNPSNVQPIALSEWTDEDSAYNQTYSKENPPTSYEVLKFVRQYTQTIPELVTYSSTNDSLETFAAIQFTTLEAFQSEFDALQAIVAVSDHPITPLPHTVDFDQFYSKGTTFEVETTETYKIATVPENQFVTYDVHYTVRLHTDHLQITNITRKEVNA